MRLIKYRTFLQGYVKIDSHVEFWGIVLPSSGQDGNMSVGKILANSKISKTVWEMLG